MQESGSGEWIRVADLPCGFCQIDGENGWKLLNANDRLFQIYGCRREEGSVRYGTFQALIHPAEWDGVAKKLATCAKMGMGSFELEVRGARENGSLLALTLCFSATDKRGLVNCVLFDVTRQRELLERLKQNNKEQKLLLQQTERFILRYYVQTGTAVMMPETAKELGVPEHIYDFPECMADTIPMPASRDEFLKFFRQMEVGVPEGDGVFQLRNGMGEDCWYRCTYSLITDNLGQAKYSLVSLEDISEQREKEIACEKWSQHNKTQLADSVLYYECNLSRNQLDDVMENCFFQVPRAMLTSYDILMGYIGEELVWAGDRQLHRDFVRRETLLAEYHAGKREMKREYRLVAETGEPLWAHVAIQLLPDPYSNDIKAFILVKDIDSKKKRELLLQERSLRDSLTGVLNRGAVIEQINEILRVGDTSLHHVLIMVDVDNFKSVNDQIGHFFGDQVLVGIAKALKAGLRKGDLVGRLGGDEFVVFMKDMPTGGPLVNKLDYLCDRLYIECGKHHHVSGSMGVAVYPEDGLDFESLYHRADLALYEAKGKGKNQYVFYGPDLNRQEKEDGEILP